MAYIVLPKMIYRITALVVIAFCSLSIGCKDRSANTGRQVRGGAGHWVDVTANGKRYYGIANESFITQDGIEGSEYSCVVLTPWDNRGVGGVSVNRNVSTVNSKQGRFQILGRHVCITDSSGTKLTMYPAEIPTGAYEFRGSLEAAITLIIEEAEQAGTGQPATRPESKPEGGDQPQPESEGRSR